jgi:hypothetical protein
MRRILALVGHRIAAYKGNNDKTPNLCTCRGSRLGVVAIFMGRDWFPSGLYNLTGRGSTPLRSNFLTKLY